MALVALAAFAGLHLVPSHADVVGPLWSAGIHADLVHLWTVLTEVSSQ